VVNLVANLRAELIEAIITTIILEVLLFKEPFGEIIRTPPFSIGCSYFNSLELIRFHKNPYPYYSLRSRGVMHFQVRK
jgi:hypothetical protein